MPRLRPTPTEIRTLSGRDEEVVSSLARHQFLTFSQVHRLHFPDRSATPARRCLWRLADRGLAGNVFEWTPYGRQTTWYATAKGEVAAGIRLPGARRRLIRQGLRQSAKITAAEAIRSHATPSTWTRANSNTANDGPR